MCVPCVCVCVYVCVCVCLVTVYTHVFACVWCVCVCLSVWPGMRRLRIGLPGGWTVLSAIGHFASQVTNKAQMWCRAKSPHPGSARCCAMWYMQKVVSLSWWSACASLFAPGTIESVRAGIIYSAQPPCFSLVFDMQSAIQASAWFQTSHVRPWPSGNQV